MSPFAEVTFIVPAFEEEGIAEVVSELRRLYSGARILVVDDGSKDDTGARAEAAGAEVLRHPYNKGNGASVKTGLRAARSETVVLLDADGQHQPAEAARLLERLGEYDLVIGARDGATEGDWWRRFANATYNRLASLLTGFPILDLTSGFRAARRAPMVEFLSLYPNGFSYPTTSTLAFLRAGYDVAFVPVTMRRRRFGSSKVKLLRDGGRFFLIILKMATLYDPLRVFLPIAAFFSILGTLYGLGTYVVSGKLANGALLAWLLAVVVFVVGLLSEQINALRVERHRD